MGTSSVLAQDFSLKVMGGSVLSMPITNSFYDNQRVQPNLGFAFSVGYEYQINNRWALLLDAAILSARYTVQNSNRIIQTQYTNLFLETPLGVKYRIITNTNRFIPYVLAGVSSNFLVSSTTKGTYPNIFNISLNEEAGSESFVLANLSGRDQTNYRLQSTGLLTGAGISLWSEKKYTLGIEIRYTHGLQNFLNTTVNDLSFYNRLLTIGIQFQFGL